jgi:TPR repeat protein
MKWPAIVAICAGLAGVQACTTGANGPKYSESALEELYRTDLDRANGGEIDAMMRLGHYYDHGLSVNDRCKGVLEALCRMGMSRLISGEVVARDRIQAYKWYSLAAMQDHEKALLARQKVIAAMSPKEIDEGNRQVDSWLESMFEPPGQSAAETGS